MNFWEERWQNDKTGWHNQAVNENLQKHHTILFQQKTPTLFVPLCGKTLDMWWLHEQGAQIIGVDLVRKALEDYCAEQSIEAIEESTEHSLFMLKGNDHTLIHGDIFDVTQKEIGHVDGIFDRAALVALPLELRQRYATHCLSVLKPGGKILLITYDSPVKDDQGPPFPVRKGTIEALYSNASSCTQIDEVTMTPENSPRLKQRGLAWSRSDIWEITK